MKKFFISLGLTTATMLSAQVDFSQTRFGVIAGGNYSRIRNAHNPSGARTSFQVGATALIPIGNEEMYYIQPEIVYYEAGETGKDKTISKTSKGYNAIYANNYISVPLYFKGFFSEAESEFFGLFGPRFNFLVNQKVSNPSREHYNINGAEGSKFNGKANSFNFAIGAGVGFSYKRQLELSLRYDLGLSNTYKGLMGELTSDPNTDKKKSEQVVSLTLNYIFD